METETETIERLCPWHRGYGTEGEKLENVNFAFILTPICSATS